MTLSEMRELPIEELRSEAEKMREKLWKLRFRARGEPVENPGEVRRIRKDIARVLTVITQKQSS